MAHWNRSPVTAVNLSWNLTHLDSRNLHRHGATIGRADSWGQVRSGRVPNTDRTLCPATKPTAPRDSTPWTWGTRHGTATKSQGLFGGYSELPGQREDNYKEERDFFFPPWREFYLRAENSRNAGHNIGAFSGGLKAPPCRSPQMDFNSFDDAQT